MLKANCVKFVAFPSMYEKEISRSIMLLFPPGIEGQLCSPKAFSVIQCGLFKKNIILVFASKSITFTENYMCFKYWEKKLIKLRNSYYFKLSCKAFLKCDLKNKYVLLLLFDIINLMLFPLLHWLASVHFVFSCEMACVNYKIIINYIDFKICLFLALYSV